jgi:hypothetical protein
MERRNDGIFSRDEFSYDKERNDRPDQVRRHAPVQAQQARLRCLCIEDAICPKDTSRGLLRNVYEEARDVARAIARSQIFEQSYRERKRIEMPLAHLKRILRLDRLRLRLAKLSPDYRWPETHVLSYVTGNQSVRLSSAGIGRLPANAV